MLISLAVCDYTARDSRANFNWRIFSFHLQDLTVEAAVSAAESIFWSGPKNRRIKANWPEKV